jgi:hypothetical protein
MLNWSFSLNAARRGIEEDVVEREDVVPQNDFFSVGEGGKYTPESLISAGALRNQCAIRENAWMHGLCASHSPLSLYSGGWSLLLSSVLLAFVAADSLVFLDTGRTFSSCLRKGLRIIGMAEVEGKMRRVVYCFMLLWGIPIGDKVGLVVGSASMRWNWRGWRCDRR